LFYYAGRVPRHPFNSFAKAAVRQDWEEKLTPEVCLRVEPNEKTNSVWAIFKDGVKWKIPGMTPKDYNNVAAGVPDKPQMKKPRRTGKQLGVMGSTAPIWKQTKEDGTCVTVCPSSKPDPKDQSNRKRSLIMWYYTSKAKEQKLQMNINDLDEGAAQDTCSRWSDWLCEIRNFGNGLKCSKPSWLQSWIPHTNWTFEGESEGVDEGRCREVRSSPRRRWQSKREERPRRRKENVACRDGPQGGQGSGSGQR
jgi:hypothetical protein